MKADKLFNPEEVLKTVEPLTQELVSSSPQEREVLDKCFITKLACATNHLDTEDEKRSVICCGKIADLIKHLPTLYEYNFTLGGQEDLAEMHKHILDWMVTIFSSYLQETDKYNTFLTQTNKVNQ